MQNHGIQQLNCHQEKGCQVEKKFLKNWKGMRVRLVFYLFTILQQLLSYNNYHLVVAIVLHLSSRNKILEPYFSNI
jgi:hypothetical protein